MKLYRYSSITAILLILFGFVKGQNTDSVKVIGQISADSGAMLTTEFTKVYLNPLNPGDDYFYATVDAHGAFTIMVPVQAPTMYILKYRDYKMEVLLCPTEPVFKIAIKADNREVKNMHVVDSHEYEAFRNFKKVNNGFKGKLPGLLAGSSQHLKKEIVALNSLLEYLRVKYKNTYTANVLVPMAEMPEINTAKPALPQLQQHFFDGANVTDTMLYRTLEFNDEVSTYIDAVADTTIAGRLAFINALTAKANKSNRTEKDILLLLLNNFTDAKRENYLESLVQWAATQKSLSETQPVVAAKLQLLAKTLPGAHAPEASGLDVNDKPLSLSDVLKKNKLTLVVFWSSECPHCKKEMPQVISLYQKYHDKGLEVFAASVEPNDDKWKQYLAANKLPWQNIKLWEDSPAHADYCIQFTPTFVVIDNNGIILRRFIGIDDLDGIIGKVLENK